MAVANTNELQNKILSLKRAPCPKAPTSGPTNEFLKGVKLRPTNISQEWNGNTNSESSDNSNQPTKERSLSVKDRLKTLENDSPENKPIQAKKPVIQAKPNVSGKPVVPGKPAVARKDMGRIRPPSVIDKPSAHIPKGYEDTRVPELKPLPPKPQNNPPEKPPKLKLWVLRQSLKKYVGTDHPPRPVVAAEPPPVAKKEERKPAMPLPVVQDAPPIPSKPKKPDFNAANQNGEKQTNNANEGAGDSDAGEDFYDDTFIPSKPGGDQDFYDDTVGSKTEDEEFGEELYEPITNAEEQYELLPAENESLPPPALPPHTEKKTKEDKKKKEKEEKERRKREKEEKIREEKESKKREKEKERKLTEMRRRFSVRGNEDSIGSCCAIVDIVGNKMDIPATIGESFDIIRKDKPNPPNKWLVRNTLGRYGFIDISNVESDQGGEDLYEEVSTVKQSMHSISEGGNFPAPPTTSPPPPPGNIASAVNEEFYDDVAAGEELYEPLDN